MVGQGGVVVVSVGGAGADVHGDVGELGYVVQEPVVRRDSDRMGLDDAERGVDDDAGLGPHPVTRPAQPQPLDLQDTRGGAQARLGGVEQLR